MSLFNLSIPEVLCFFAVLVRFSVLIALLPFTGDKTIPTPIKVLLSLAITLALFPALVARGEINPAEALVWGGTTAGIVKTVVLEAVIGFVLGYTARLSFDAISLGSNLVGTFMGYASASMYDPHQETHSQVVAEIQMALAMLIFLTLDGHHLMLRASLDSYRIVGLGQAEFGAQFVEKITMLSGQVIRFGIQIAAPVAISLFAVNVMFGIMSRAMPNLNVLMLSFSVTGIVGLLVMLISMPEYQSVAGNILERMGDSMETMLTAMASK